MSRTLNFHPVENSLDTSNVCVPLLIDMYNPKSVLDLGCNVGCWLCSFEISGVNDVMGVDGDNMIDFLWVDSSKFIAHDLTQKLNINRKFDLVLCLEVAEHLDEKYGDILIENCINHSDIVIWSAATIGQGGYNHVNEQPLQYWIDKFVKKGYSARQLCDILPELPHDYYRKNAIEFKKI